MGSNKRLIRNTIMLYSRLFVIMLVSLYTSRVALNALGVEDFGVYNIVAGVVVLFSFISQALNSACNRFLSIAVGKGVTSEIQSTFSTALTVHSILVLIVFLTLELAGVLVFRCDILNIPEGRVEAAMRVYHIASLCVCFNIIRTPFNASIIAHEDMSFYAYSSIVEAFLKLIVVFVISAITYDKLISYSVLMLAVVFLVNIWYIVYCLKKYKGNRISFHSSKERIYEMLSFCGWGAVGGIADISWQQGTNLVLNSFYGVTLNSAMGIANQIKSAVNSVSSNLLVAANPQIIKSYSSGDSSRFFGLIYSMSKFSFFLMLVFTLPLIMNMDFVLSVWLVSPPENTSVMSSLILIACNISILVGPLWTGVQAVGEIKKYNIVVGLILIMNIPVTFLAFHKGFGPESMIIIQILISVVQVAWVLHHSKQMYGLNLTLYSEKVVFPIIFVSLFVVTICYFSVKIFSFGWMRFILSFVINLIALCVSVYFVGLSKDERKMVKQFVATICKEQ